LHDFPHVPAAQVGLPFAVPGQTLLHDPQWFTSVCSATHTPSQLVYPSLHEIPQVPPLHVGEPFAVPGQALSHAPQLFTSLC